MTIPEVHVNLHEPIALPTLSAELGKGNCSAPPSGCVTQVPDVQRWTTEVPVELAQMLVPSLVMAVSVSVFSPTVGTEGGAGAGDCTGVGGGGGGGHPALHTPLQVTV